MEVKQHSPLPQQPPFFRPGLGRIPLITPKMEAASSSESHMATSSNTGLNLSTSLPGSVLVSTVIKTEPRSRSPCPMVVGSSTSSVPADSPNNNNALMNLSSLALSASGYVVQSQHSVTSPTPAKRPRAALATPEEAWLASPSQMSIDSMSPPPSAPTMQGGPTHAPPSVSSNGYCPSPMSTGSYEPYSPGHKGRDDLSPPGSVNGYGSGGDSMGADLKKKKGPVPRQAEELCLVCGDRASGYHYNALTCEGCKGFFRRSVTKNAIYHCKYGDSCEIDMYMRRKCQECRFKKCLAVGMRSECVVPEQQCVVKREAKKAQKEKEKPNSNPVSSVNSPDSKDLDQHRQQQKGNRSSESQAWGRLQEDKAGRLASPVANVSNPFGVKPLSPEQEELINRLVYFQEEFDQPSEEDLKKVTQISLDGDDSSDRRFKYITEMTILTVQLTVEFSKRLPGFDTLHREDQITLLKACSSEVMMLRCARRYDANSDSIVFANNYPYTKESYKLAGVGDSADAIFHFGRQMANMKVDNAEYALLTAVVIFSERPNLLEARKVEKIQEIYLEALQAYVLNHRPKPMTEFAKLLSVLTELRTLGNLNSEMCFSLKLKNKMLPPFLAELWDVHG